MHIVYVIQHTIDKIIYIGITVNLKQRLKQHNSNESHFTRRKEGKWILIYAEAYRSKEDAQDRERKLKAHGNGKHELYKRIKRSML